MSRRLGVLLVLTVVAALAVGIWWFLGDDAPAPVSLEAAVASVDGQPTAGAMGNAAGVAGSWVVDATSGDFDYETATGTFVGFRIGEELASIGRTEAVGRTGDVPGSLTIDGTTLTAARFEATMTSITTNESRRDDKVQRALDTDSFPVAWFELTEPVEVGGGTDRVDVVATGELTIRGITRTVEVSLEARLVDGTMVVVGSLDVRFSDFGVEVPSAPIVLSADDHGVVELQLLLTRA